MEKEKKYCPCCGHEMFEFALGSKKVFICSYAPCQTKYYSDSGSLLIMIKASFTGAFSLRKNRKLLCCFSVFLSYSSK